MMQVIEAPQPAAQPSGTQEPSREPDHAPQQQPRPPSVDAQQAAQAALSALPAAGDMPEAERLLALCSRLAQVGLACPITVHQDPLLCSMHHAWAAAGHMLSLGLQRTHACPQDDCLEACARGMTCLCMHAQDEAAAAEGAPGGAALQQLLGSFLEDVRASLGDGSLQPGGEDAGAAAAAQEARLLAELAAQRDTLAVRLVRFKQVRALV